MHSENSRAAPHYKYYLNMAFWYDILSSWNSSRAKDQRSPKTIRKNIVYGLRDTHWMYRMSLSFSPNRILCLSKSFLSEVIYMAWY